MKSMEEKVKDLGELVDVQCTDGTWNFSEYMRGMANGLLLAKSVFDDDDERVPFFEAPEDNTEHLV